MLTTCSRLKILIMRTPGPAVIRAPEIVELTQNLDLDILWMTCGDYLTSTSRTAEMLSSDGVLNHRSLTVTWFGDRCLRGCWPEAQNPAAPCWSVIRTDGKPVHAGFIELKSLLRLASAPCLSSLAIALTSNYTQILIDACHSLEELWLDLTVEHCLTSTAPSFPRVDLTSCNRLMKMTIITHQFSSIKIDVLEKLLPLRLKHLRIVDHSYHEWFHVRQTLKLLPHLHAFSVVCMGKTRLPVYTVHVGYHCNEDESLLDLIRQIERRDRIRVFDPTYEPRAYSHPGFYRLPKSMQDDEVGHWLARRRENFAQQKIELWEQMNADQIALTGTQNLSV